MTEQELVDRAKAGDTVAFEQLVLREQGRIYTLCLRMLGNQEDAMDAAQEAFLKAWRGLPSFRGGSSFSTWIYRLASHACIDLLRRRSRWKGLEGSLSLDDPNAPPLPVPDQESDPQKQLERRELHRAVEEGLRALTPRQREILVLREMFGLSYQEIGEQLKLDPGTVKSRIARARLALKKELMKPGNFFSPDSSKQSEK